MKSLFSSLVGAVLLASPAIADSYARVVHCEKNAGGGGGAHWSVELLDDVGNGAYHATVKRNGAILYSQSTRPLMVYREGRRSTWKSGMQTVGLSIDQNGQGQFYTHFYNYSVANLNCAGESKEESATAESAMLPESAASGPTLACRIANESNVNPIDVPFARVSGNLIKPTPVTKFQGHDVRVVWNVGSKFESQTLLTLSVDKISSRSYNLSANGIYQMHGPDFFLQCAFK